MVNAFASKSQQRQTEIMMSTAGEGLFEHYLATQNLPFEFEKEHAGKTKRPDYTIEWGGRTIKLDVKDFDPPKTSTDGVVAFDPYTRIREKIDQSREQFKQYKEYCCGLILFNQEHPLVSLDDPYIMLGSMYGDAGLTVPVDLKTGIGDASKVKQTFLDHGKMIRPKRAEPQNRTISALITLTTVRPYYELFLKTYLASRTHAPEDVHTELAHTIPDYDPDLERFHA